MNIFYLHDDPVKSAKLHCDKHVVKMVIEYAQLLSTAHRILDGTEYQGKTKLGRNIRRWKMKDSVKENVLYKASHIKHPSAIWVRENAIQYQYMYDMFVALCDEYTYRYGKRHKSEQVIIWCIANRPNIPDLGFTKPAKAMPDEYKVKDVVQSYRNYYMGAKSGFAKWKNRDVPKWFKVELDLV